jgi:hypothetical protein
MNNDSKELTEEQAPLALLLTVSQTSSHDLLKMWDNMPDRAYRLHFLLTMQEGLAMLKAELILILHAETKK